MDFSFLFALERLTTLWWHGTQFIFGEVRQFISGRTSSIFFYKVRNYFVADDFPDVTSICLSVVQYILCFYLFFI